MANKKKSKKSKKKPSENKDKKVSSDQKSNKKAKKLKKLFYPAKLKNLSLIKKIIYGFVFIISLFFLFIFSLAFGIYFLNFKNQFVRYFTKVIPYPAVYINKTENLSVHEFFVKLNSIEKYSSLKKITENQESYPKEITNEEEYYKTIKKEILNQMILNSLIEIALDKNNIQLESQEIEDQTVQELKKYGDFEKVKTDLKKVYGIEIADYSAYAVKNKLYREKLQDYLLKKDILNQDQSPEEQAFLTKEWIKTQTKDINVTILFHQYKFNKNTLEVEVN
jgi:hypothetical protein